jgi:outer membrane scaffolding protein for murein synthesis (MipA/OmpV family)
MLSVRWRVCVLGLSLAVPVLSDAAASDAVAPLDALPTYRESVFEDRWSVSVGGFAGVEPAYEGSGEYRATGYPLLFPRYLGEGTEETRSRLTFRGLDDIRVSVLRSGGLDVGPLAGYTFGRDEDVSRRLRGLGDIDGGLTLGGFASYAFDPFFVDLAYVRQVTGQDDAGYTLRFGAGIAQPIDERLTLSAYVNSSYASEDYMDTYFSVSPAQSAASLAGLAAFDAGAGIKDVGVDLGLDYRLSERVTLTTRAGYARLLDDAAASPVTTSRNQFSGGLGFTYTFGAVQ